MVLIGVAGWSYADWKGTVYPRRKPRGFHPLTYLARYIDLMEVNSSFYALPQPERVDRWARLVEPFPRFRFTAKLHGSFSHGPVEDMDAEVARAFCAGLAPLSDAGRLLCLLAQFPVFFRQDEAGWQRLERIRTLFPEQRLLLELRHRSWFEPSALERMEALDFGLAHIDLPAAHDHPPADHPSLGDLGYLRLHGRNRDTWFDAKAGRDDRYDYRYDRRELVALADRMRVIGTGTERSLLVANNHFGGQALANALELKGLLEGVPARAPEPLVTAFPDLRQWTEPEGQMSLF